MEVLEKETMKEKFPYIQKPSPSSPLLPDLHPVIDFLLFVSFMPDFVFPFGIEIEYLLYVWNKYCHKNTLFLLFHIQAE